MTGISSDLNLGIRRSLREPVAALGAIVTLAIGVGVNSAVFNLADHLLLRPLPFAQPERLVSVTATQDGAPVGALSGPLYVGDPRWDVGRAVHGSPEQIAAFLRVLAGFGVDQIQVAFRSRDVHELYDQLRVFGAEVAPLVTR